MSAQASATKTHSPGAFVALQLPEARSQNSFDAHIVLLLLLVVVLLAPQTFSQGPSFNLLMPTAWRVQSFA